MTSEHGSGPLTASLPEITRHDRARFVREARRLRAAEFDRQFAAIGRGLAPIFRAITSRQHRADSHSHWLTMRLRGARPL